MTLGKIKIMYYRFISTVTYFVSVQDLYLHRHIFCICSGPWSPPSHILYLFRTFISTVTYFVSVQDLGFQHHMWVFFYVQWVNVISDCSFFLYWSNWWPSLFKENVDIKSRRVSGTTYIRYVSGTTYIRYVSGTTYIRYVQNRKIGKPIRFLFICKYMFWKSW